MTPVFVGVVLAIVQVLAAGLCRELAAHAAQASAAALLQDRDARAAGRAAVPGWSRGRLRIDVEGRRVDVVIRAPMLLPGLAGQLDAHARADAGPRS